MRLYTCIPVNILRAKRKVFLKWLYYVAVLFIVYGIIAQLLYSDTPVNGREKEKYTRKFSDRRILKNKTKNVILVWTPFWFEEREVTGMATRCEVTTDKSRLDESDVIMFHLPDLLPWIKLPTTRKADQVWVLYSLEPPPRIIWYAGGSMWKNVFNWTLSYRRDATIFAPYYRYEPLSVKQKSKTTANKINFLANKTKFAIATISDCYDDAGRYKDVYALQKYIDVDVYGYCGNKDCKPSTKRCEQTIKDYKFQLAFENAYCNDYITEKYWDALKRKLIPIVNWKTDPTNIVFPNSYININDFPNMKSVAEYMKKVADDESLYNSFFDWTREFKITCHCGCDWCINVLCEALYNQMIPTQVITDPFMWTAAEDTCQVFSVGSMIGSRGGTGGPDPHTPEKSPKYRVSWQYWSSTLKKITKLQSQHLILGLYRHASETPF